MGLAGIHAAQEHNDGRLGGKTRLIQNAARALRAHAGRAADDGYRARHQLLVAGAHIHHQVAVYLPQLYHHGSGQHIQHHFLCGAAFQAGGAGDDLRPRLWGDADIRVGLESGCDEVLRRMNKGHTAAAIVAAGQKARRCGLALSVTAISGLGSRELMREHAIGTAKAFSAMKPEYIGLLTLMVEPGTPLEKWVREGSFTVLGPEDILRETELLLQHIDSEGSVFRMNHASNYLTLKGTLNQDRDAMLERVRKGLEGYGLRPEYLRAL